MNMPPSAMAATRATRAIASAIQSASSLKNRIAPPGNDERAAG